MKRKIQLLLSLVIILAFVLAGCTPAATEEPATAEEAAPEEAAPEEAAPEEAAPEEAAPEEAAPAEEEAPAEKNVFVFGRYGDAIIPDPVMNDANYDIWYMQQYYSGLLRFTPENTVEGDLAESWEISEDSLTYTFYLRPDLKFADGSPITPEDWEWSLKRAANPDNGIWWFTFESVDTIVADEEKVVFTLKEPYTPFIFSVALFNSVVMPMKLVEAAGGWEAFMEKPIGAGPFIMTEWLRGESMQLVKNPYYWDAANVSMDEILLKTILDDNARIIALQAGEVDAINYPPFNRVTDLSADPDLTVLTFPSTYTSFIALNNREAPLDDIKVRQALSYAIDRQALIDTLNFGVGEPATTWRPRGTLYYNYDLEGWPFDVEKAQSLMEEAGYGDGFPLTLEIRTGREADAQKATILKDMWAKIGVDVTIVPLEQGLYSDNYYNNNFQVQITGWTDDIPDPSQGVNYAIVFNTSESYHTGFQSDEVDQLAAEALTTPDGPEREAMYYRLQEIFNENAPFLPLYHEPYLVISRSNVSNFYQTPLGTYIWRDLQVSE
ncbi:MAG: ABC transporter substrate-binding protein [Anaerolineaceae bacterium]|nr:ABC transporter substrate-binding protein [Anaerolineaceae bacterium]